MGRKIAAAVLWEFYALTVVHGTFLFLNSSLGSGVISIVEAPLSPRLGPKAEVGARTAPPPQSRAAEGFIPE